MISFTNPAWLYGLFGLAIPIGIHLLSRKEGKTIYIGSIRHLVDSDTAQFSSIRLNEIMLLLLRMLLIIFLVLILAGLTIEKDNLKGKKWLLIEKGVEREKGYASMIDSLTAESFEIHWWAEGFPRLSDSSSIPTIQNYATLLQELPKTLDSVVIMSYSSASRFKGEKLPLPGNVLWFPVEPVETTRAIEAVALRQDSVSVRLMNSKSTGTALQYSRMSPSEFARVSKIDSLQVRNPDTIRVSIYSNEKFSYDRKIIQAALRSLSKLTPHVLQINLTDKASQFSSTNDFIFWLSDEQIPSTKSVSFGYVACSAQHLPLIASSESLRNFCEASSFDWIITKRLNEENVLEESFMYSMAQIILPKTFEKDVNQSDRRVLTSNSAFSELQNEGTAAVHGQTQAGTEPVLAVLLFIILIVERSIAYKRNQ